MVVIKNMDSFVFDEKLCWVERDIEWYGEIQYVVCTKRPVKVPEQYVEYEVDDVEHVIDDFTRDAIKYILDKYLDELIDVAKEMGINIDVNTKRKGTTQNNRTLDEFFA